MSGAMIFRSKVERSDKGNHFGLNINRNLSPEVGRTVMQEVVELLPPDHQANCYAVILSLKTPSLAILDALSTRALLRGG